MNVVRFFFHLFVLVVHLNVELSVCFMRNCDSTILASGTCYACMKVMVYSPTEMQIHKSF